jgi:hypothetical protein
MVQKVVPYEVCDIHLPDEVNADKTISFTYGLVGYELDVCARHGDDVAKKLAKVDEILGALAGNARKISTPARARSTRPGSAPAGPRRRTAADKMQTAYKRQWLRENGHPGLSDRGRIPRDLEQKYELAHPAA